MEVERERLAEYVRVLSKRLAAAEEKSSEAEFYLRDERRKTAKLERMLEQAHVEMRNQNVIGSSGSASSSVPGTPARVTRDQRDEIEALAQELREFKRDIDGLRARRNEDLEFFLNNNNNSNKKTNGSNKKRKSKTSARIDMRPEWRSD